MRDGNSEGRHPQVSGGEPPPQEEAGKEHGAPPWSTEKDRSAKASERKSQRYQKSD